MTIKSAAPLIEGLREMIASGRLTAAMIPDDFQWLEAAIDEEERTLFELRRLAEMKTKEAVEFRKYYAEERQRSSVAISELNDVRDRLNAMSAETLKERS